MDEEKEIDYDQTNMEPVYENVCGGPPRYHSNVRCSG